VSDLLERIRTELDQRLAALRPSVDEYERLLRGAEALAGVAPLGARGSAGTGEKAAAPPAKRARRTKPRPAKRAARARPGQTQLRVIEVLRTAPGSTSTAVAKAVGISTNAAAATISRLVKQGRVQRRDEGGYVTAEPAAATPPAAAAEPAAAEPVAAVTPDPAAAPPAEAGVEPEPVAPAEAPAPDAEPRSSRPRVRRMPLG
jgi:hypothetical protein